MKTNIDLEIENDLWSRGIRKIAGVDEAGRGPLAGPVVAAAVIFPENLIINGVDDSKKLSPKKREMLYDLIVEKAISVGVGIVSHEVIDRVNIMNATLLAMNRALRNLRVSPDYVIVDGNFFKNAEYKVQNIVDGDARSFTIAAASIIAKVTRDRLMIEFDGKFPQYGFAKHKGYGTFQHIEAIKKYGLTEIHRRSFCSSFCVENLYPTK